MSEDSDSKPYLYSTMEDQDGASACRGASSCSSMPRGASGCGSMPRGASGCSSMAQLHRMGGYVQGGPDLGLPSEGSDSSSQDRPASPHRERKSARSHSLQEEDVEMKSSSCSGTESHGNESHGNDSHGNESTGSSNGNSKDSALLESSASNKSSNSHSSSPPSSSNAFSLLSSEQDNPSTSGCSSEESAKAKTQKELLKTLKELKRLLPAEKKNKGNKSTTLNTLKYALRCVKQVEANEEYYQLFNDSQPSGLNVSSYTIDDIDSITSEYTLKNNDIFAVAVSLITGKIVYISDQAAFILNCKRDVFKNAKFAEFLIPQDVSVFYSFTTPYRLPSWSMCTGAESSPPDCMQEKSFFCRISGGKEREGDLQYYPFRMTPYLMKVQDKVHAEDQFCCLLLAERVHSGYDAPRIPTDKRIFTTTHTPSCVIQDVDERAVPLLGYLPQDLIGTSFLLHLHPNDRPIMLAIHRKILQYAGQPFDHSSIRFCARNGEYVTIDTSWSSFVNPWSRKVSFVIGRHKVRMGPVNEDVFASPIPALVESKTMDSDIQEITEQIHRLLLQPVHNSGSSGYGSLGSNDHLMAVTSSGESSANGNGCRTPPNEEGESSKAKPQRTFQEICKDVHLQKREEQQVYQASSAKPDTKKSPGKSLQKSSTVAVRPKDMAVPLSLRESGATLEESRVSGQEELAFNDQTVYSYQQISCLDSVIRYLESCNVPITMKRKCHSSSNTNSSDEEKQKGPATTMRGSQEPALLKSQPGQTSPLDAADKKQTTGTAGTLAPLAVPSKAESVVSITSQCSYSSTIVHVGDKKPQPESEIIEDVSGAGEAVEGSQTPGPAQNAVPYKKLGLTKQVLAAHTQKEEQVFLCRFREVQGAKAFKADCSQYLERQRGQVTTDAVPAARPCKQVGEPAARRNKKTKSKRAKQREASDSTVSRQRQRHQHLRAPPINQGLNQSSWSLSETSQSTFPLAYPAVVPAYPLQVYPGTGTMTPQPDAPSLPGYSNSRCSQDPRCQPQPTLQPPPYSAPMVTPMMALVLPNYIFPQMGNGALPPPQQAYYGAETSGFPGQPTAFPVQTAFPSQSPYPPQCAFPTQASFAVQAQFQSQNPFNAQAAGFPAQPYPFSLPQETPKPMEGQSRCSTPQSTGARDQASSPPLFQSRCSSPLQLNLLQLEETRDSMAPSTGGLGTSTTPGERGGNAVVQAMEEQLQQPSLILLGPPGPSYYEDTQRIRERLSWDSVCSRLRGCNEEMGSPDEGNHSDGNSSTSDLLDILLQEDSSGSATSGSMGSGSRGCGTSASGTSNSRTSNSRTSASRTSNSRTSKSKSSASGTSAGRASGRETRSSSHASNNSSNYFGSVDSSQNSSQNSQKVKDHSINGSSGAERPMEVEQSEQFIKCVLQDQFWLLMANADDKALMTYQMPSRDIQRVLREDREKLRGLQKSQPRYTEDQRRELLTVHPWMRRGILPKAIDVKACMCCEDVSEAVTTEEQPDLDMGETETETGRGVNSSRKPSEEELSNMDSSSGCGS